MAKIGLIATSKKIYKTTETVIESMRMEETVEIVQASLDGAVAVARRMEKEGFDVIIARGNTAELIMEEVSTPVVLITVSSQDVLQSLYHAKQLTGLKRPRIAVVTFKGVSVDEDLLGAALNVELKIYHNAGQGYSGIPGILAKVKKDGADAVVGGLMSVQIAKEHKLKNVLWNSGFESIHMALTEARKLVYAIKLEQARAQRMKMMVEHIREGVMYTEADGRIQISNPAAQRMLNRSAAQLFGQNVGDLINVPGIADSLTGQHEIVEEIVEVGENTLVFSMYPVKVDKDVSGAMVYLQEGKTISSMGARLRSNLFNKGLVASYRFTDILGESPALREAKQLAEEFARMDSTVLLLGETGTGKEMFAQSIHNASRLAGGPFVAVNCAALPPTLLESELFGYEEGAFTGASRKGKPGLIELSHGGTLFLDEVSEMDQYGQIRLLRFLQEKQIMRLGGGKYSMIQARVVAASNKNLRKLVEEGKFREDLYFRLKVLSLRLPPLRERIGDVPYLIDKAMREWERKLNRKPRIAAQAMAELEAYPWPGNVRELLNAIESLVASCGEDTITPVMVRRTLDMDKERPDASPAFMGGDRADLAAHFAITPRQQSERDTIILTLRACNGSYTKAAHQLGMHRSTLYRKIRQFGITLNPE